MKEALRRQIYNELNLKETDDLLEIWQKNDRIEWSNEAFEAINEVLKNRGIEIPQQDEPIYEHNEEGDEAENYDLTDEELKIIKDENPPEFYEPLEVIKTSRWIELSARGMIVLIVIQGLFDFSNSQRLVQGFFIMHPDSSWILPASVLLVAANIIVGILVAYFPLIVLSKILRILMEMEFSSRKGKSLAE